VEDLGLEESMLVGHFAVAFLGKRIEPRLSLGTLMLASMFADILWPILSIAGIEYVGGRPGSAGDNLLDMSFSHSLATDAIWAALFAGVYFLWRHYRYREHYSRASLILFAAVYSHWFLDSASHKHALAPGAQTYYGLGLWNYFSATIIVEGGFWLLAIILYVRATRPKNRVGVYAFWPVVAFLTYVWIANIQKGPPPTEAVIGSLIFFLLLVLWAYWMNQTRLVHKLDGYIDRSVRMRQIMIRRLTVIVAIAIVGLAAYLFFWPVPIAPIAWTPSPNPGQTGAFAQNAGFRSLQKLIAEAGLGPEDVTRGADGFFYTGLQDGRILRFRAESGAQPELFVNTGGRPLGLQFDAQGNLIVADAFKGLLSISSDRAITILTDSVAGARMLFPDDLDIAQDGVIWFTDASQRFDLHHYILDFWEGRATGRLLSYDPKTKQTTVRMQALRFANGVALGPDDAFVLVNETISTRILRLWLKGPKAGETEVFINGLPGYPDNLSYYDKGAGEGIFWVALPSTRIELMDNIAGQPFLRKMLLRLPESLVGVKPSNVGWIIGVDVDGAIRHNMRDETGAYANITSVNQFNGHLLLGSITMKSVGRIEAP
jgi:sugar lactone lactonase YvrE